MAVSYLSAILLVCLYFVIRACEGAPYDHLFRVPAWSCDVSKVFRRTRLCNVGDQCVLRWLYSCVRSCIGGWCVSGSFVTGWSRVLMAPFNVDVHGLFCWRSVHFRPSSFSCYCEACYYVWLFGGYEKL